jgi:uncharacterized protein with GYD domain
MPHYVTLVRYTQQGISRIKDSHSRLDAAKKAAQKEGVKDSGVVFDDGKVRCCFDFRVS